jgi:hypothetical protein
VKSRHEERNTERIVAGQDGYSIVEKFGLARLVAVELEREGTIDGHGAVVAGEARAKESKSQSLLPAEGGRSCRS